MQNIKIPFNKLYYFKRLNVDYKSFFFQNEIHYVPLIKVNENNNYFYQIEINPDHLLSENLIDEFQKKLSENHINEICFRLNPFFPKNTQLKVKTTLLSKKFELNEINIIWLNLNKDLKDLKSSIRRRYKSKINKEKKILNVVFSCENKNNKKLFLDWLQIYKEALRRGNVSFTKNTSELLEKAIMNNEYLLGVAYEKDRAVGGMLFNLNERYAYYSAAANNIEVEKDKKRNVGHFLMWSSIEKLKDLSFENLELGHYIKDSNFSSDGKKNKESGITMFKTGFGGEIIKAFYFTKLF